MRIAAFSDIHGNLHALQAVWEDLEGMHPDAVYCLGDLVGYGAYPNEVVEFLRGHEIPCVMGNYDEGVGFHLHDCGCAYTGAEERRLGEASFEWTKAQVSPENKAWLQKLPLQIRLEEHRPSLLLVHGSPRKTNEYLYEDRPTASFERIALLAGTDVLLFGHTHLAYQKKVGKALFVNAGSVGRPRDGDPRAGYVLITGGRRTQVEMRRVPYDVAAAAQAVRASGLPVQFAADLESGGARAHALRS